MSYQNSLAQPFRRNLLLLGSGWRGYYAPYNVNLSFAQPNTIAGPKVVDLTQGPFSDDVLKSMGFFDIGWVKDFQIADEGKIGEIRSGFRGMVRMKIRGQVGEKIAFKMREFSRMAMKIATGNDIFNLLANSTPSVVGPISASGTGNAPVTMTSYDPNIPSLTVSSGLSFSAGDIIVCDQDYDPLVYGLIGSNATPVLRNQVTDVDYIRKTSDFVARVIAVEGDDLILSFKFAGGGSGDPIGNVIPVAGSKVQKIVGWTARKGGSLVHDWTAMFLLDTTDGVQMCEYYPHLAISASKGMPPYAIDNIGSVDFSGFELDCEQEALAFDDPEDGQPVVGYRVYYPAPTRATVQI